MTQIFNYIFHAEASVVIFAFVIPFVLALAAQTILLISSKNVWIRIFPFYIVIALIAIILLNHYFSFFAAIMGGMVSLIMLGSVLFIIIGIAFGWLCYLVICIFSKMNERKNEEEKSKKKRKMHKK